MFFLYHFTEFIAKKLLHSNDTYSAERITDFIYLFLTEGDITMEQRVTLRVAIDEDNIWKLIFNNPLLRNWKHSRGINCHCSMTSNSNMKVQSSTMRSAIWLKYRICLKVIPLVTRVDVHVLTHRTIRLPQSRHWDLFHCEGNTFTQKTMAWVLRYT